MLLQLSGVTKQFVSGDGAETLTVLDDVSLEVESGSTLSVVGPSGSGKSTLLNVIGTLDRPAKGKVELSGRDLVTLNDKELAEVRNREIGFIFQAHHLLPQCTLLENVLVPTLASNTRDGKEKPEERARRLLERVGLSGRLSHRPGQLSGGERQRVAVVRALINQPKLLLADEPTGALDHASATQLGQLLVELNREEGVTLMVVTHSRELAALMNKMFEMRDGRLEEAK